MKIELDALVRCPLFYGIDKENWSQILDALHAACKTYAAHAVIFWEGEPADHVGVVLKGAVQVTQQEYDGSRMILTTLEPGELFGETFACLPGERKTLPVTAAAMTESEVLLFDFRRMLAQDCPFHTQLVENMLAVLAQKNLFLNRRIGHLSKRSTWEKLISFLQEMAVFHESPEFTIRFTRQELADYLCVERSAMSAVLSKMRQEGIIQFKKNHFVITAALEHKSESRRQEKNS